MGKTQTRACGNYMKLVGLLIGSSQHYLVLHCRLDVALRASVQQIASLVRAQVVVRVVCIAGGRVG